MSDIESAILPLVRLKASAEAIQTKELRDAATMARAELDKLSDSSCDGIKQTLSDLVHQAGDDGARASPSTLTRLETVLMLSGLSNRLQDVDGSLGMASRSMNVTPLYVLAMEKSHAHPHGAFKDLVANSRDAKSTVCNIEPDLIKGVVVLKVWDDGKGPCDKDSGRLTEQSFLKVLDLGHSISHDDMVTTIGGNGVGLKTGLLSLARDTVVVTHNATTIFVALLSASLHEKLDARKKMKTELPWMKYNKETAKWTTTPNATHHCETQCRLCDPCRMLS